MKVAHMGRITNKLCSYRTIFIVVTISEFYAGCFMSAGSVFRIKHPSAYHTVIGLDSFLL